MAVGNNRVAMVLRNFHVILHIVTIILIIAGLFTLPDHFNEPIKWGPGRWLIFEILYMIPASIVLTVSYLVSLRKKLPSIFSRGLAWVSKNSQHWIIFYYSTMSMFVLYGCITGCHIPDVFWYRPGLRLEDKKDYFFWEKKRAWHYFLIFAIIISAINAILYFAAAFFPLKISNEVQDDNQQIPEPDQQQDIQEQENVKTDGNEVSQNQPILVAENQPEPAPAAPITTNKDEPRVKIAATGDAPAAPL